MSTISRIAGRSLLQGQKFAPEILIGVGIAGNVTAAVLAARATLKLEAAVDKLEEAKGDARNLLHEINTIDEAGYKTLLFKAHREFVFDLVKLYGPSVTLGVASVAALIGSHGIMRKRNVALVAGYKALEQAYSEYRKRVVDEIGEEKEREIHLGLRALEQDEYTPDDVPLALDESIKSKSMYARVFDQFNPNFVKNPDYNKAFLLSKQNYLNDKLLSRGHMFLNEVYDELGFNHTKQGAVVGWVVSKEGDNYIDFKMFQPENARFVNGDEYAVWLDFNVDGVIYDQI